MKPTGVRLDSSRGFHDHGLQPLPEGGAQIKALRTAACPWILGFAVAVAISLGGLESSASAALVGLERLSPASATNSQNKSVTATCPAGKRILGAGGDVTPGLGEVLIDRIRPSADLRSVTVNAVEDETRTTHDWYVQAFVICGYAPPGIERVTATSVLDSSNKGARAICPTGKRLLGAGAEINSANGQVLLEDIRLDSGLRSVTTRAVEDQNGNTANWSLSAYAICSQPVAGLELVSRGGALDSSDSKALEAPCPAGKQVTGFGGDINSPNGQVVMDAVFPNAALTGAGFAAWEDETGNNANWSLTTYALCAAAAERVAADSFAVPGIHGTVFATAQCPAGKRVTSAGGEITGGRGEVAIHALRPEPEIPTAVFGRAIADDDGFDGYMTLTTYAICSTPLAGLELVAVPTGTDSSDKAATATCPSGKRVVGTAGEVVGGLRFESDPGPPLTQRSWGEVVMDSIVPNDALKTVTVRAAEDEDGFDGSWSVTAYALCAEPPPGLKLVPAATALDSTEFAGATARCPGGQNLLGTGAAIGRGEGEVVIDDLRPDAALTSVTASGIEDATSYAGDWRVSAYAICANP